MRFSLLLVLLSAAISANAQTSNRSRTAISFGGEIGIPSASIYTIGLGFSVKGELPIVAPVSLTLTAGYSTFFYKNKVHNNSRTPSAAQFLPLKLGGRYYVSKDFFAEGELGTVLELNYLRQDLFVFSIGPGFQVPLDVNHALDIGVRYESWSRNQVHQTGIRVGYRFGK